MTAENRIPDRDIRTFDPVRYRAIEELLSPATDEQIFPLAMTARSAAECYLTLVEYNSENGDIETHKRRLRSIESAARKLFDLISSEPLLPILLGVPVFDLDDDGNSRRERELKRELAALSKQAAIFADNPGVLRFFRVDPREGERQKSAERLYLWEPIFKCWQKTDLPMGTNRASKLFDFLIMVHQWIGIESPSRETLYKALQAFKAQGT